MLTTRIDAGTHWRVGWEFRPWLRRLCNQLQVAIERLNPWRQTLKEKVGWDEAMLHRQGNLEKARDASCALGVSHDGLDTADVQRFLSAPALSVTKENARNGFGLLRVTGRGSVP